MTLCTEHIEAPSIYHTLLVGSRPFREFGHQRRQGFVVLRVIWREILLPHCVLGKLLGVSAKLDVDTTSSHVRCNRDGAGHACLGNDVRLTFVLLRVEHLEGDSSSLQRVRYQLRLLDGRRSHQHRLARFETLLDVVGKRSELVILVDVHDVTLIQPRNRAIGRDHRDLEAVDLNELALLGDGSTRHPRELLVHPEIVLERDRCEGLVLLFDLDAFLGLDRLMETL